MISNAPHSCSICTGSTGREGASVRARRENPRLRRLVHQIYPLSWPRLRGGLKSSHRSNKPEERKASAGFPNRSITRSTRSALASLMKTQDMLHTSYAIEGGCRVGPQLNAHKHAVFNANPLSRTLTISFHTRTQKSNTHTSKRSIDR